MQEWNPWHGCRKFSEGCLHCYVYRRDESIGKDASAVTKTGSFALPLRRMRNGEYKIPPGSEVFTCFTSDFFLEEADGWREEAWNMIRIRADLQFSIITKRIARFADCIPADWGDGYKNVTIGCTVENQKQADIRLPGFNAAPIQNRFIICEPLLEKIELEKYLGPAISQVIAGGESGRNARVCDCDWVLDLRRQCIAKNVPFHFKQTGAVFRKNGKIYRIPRSEQHAQAARAGMDTESSK